MTAQCINCGKADAPHETVDGPMCSGCLSACIDMKPKINVMCETPDGFGSMFLNVIRVEHEDDGSLTAVTDYWPPR